MRDLRNGCTHLMAAVVGKLPQRRLCVLLLVVVWFQKAV